MTSSGESEEMAKLFEAHSLSLNALRPKLSEYEGEHACEGTL